MIRRPILIRTLVVIVVVIAGVLVFNRVDDRRVLRETFQLIRLPASVRNVTCSSPITTDVIVDCYFDNAPQEFDQLLTGWRFAEYVPGVMKNNAMYNSAGTTFPVDRIYSADVSHDSAFVHGGNVLFYVDSGRTRVRASLYIE